MTNAVTAMTNAVTAALAEKREPANPTPRGFMMQHSDELTSVLPSHIQAQGEAWLRLAAGALKTGKVAANGRFELENAAMNNPAAFMQALRRAAHYGLQPGTEQFYLTPRPVKGRMEILGIIGYQGYIELIYRAGYTSAVIVQTVHEGESFEYVPGRDIMPIHHIDWRAPRGKLELVYAYAKMHDGSVSNVIILNESDIEEIKKSSASAKFDSSPWKTHPRAMWLKSAVRQLVKWIPSSTEIRGTGGAPVLPVVSATGAGEAPTTELANANQAQLPEGARLQIHDPDEVIDGELVEPAADEEPPPAEPDEPQMEKRAQSRMMALFAEKGFKDTKDRHDFVTLTLPGVVVSNSRHLTVSQGSAIITALEALSTPEEVTPDVPSDSPAGQ